jgi:hypothetical protein
MTLCQRCPFNLLSMKNCKLSESTLTHGYSVMADHIPIKIFWVVQHVVDLNRSGRFLLQDYDLPPSIWPIALARANQNLREITLADKQT